MTGVSAAMGSVRERAPAKLNLGLAVVGRRDDGFHELVTIFQTVDLWDDVTLTAAPEVRLAGDDPAGDGERNLALVAAERLRRIGGGEGGLLVELRKRIPVAAGLGGASSDAAAVLRGGRALLAPAVSDVALAALAVGIGSDVPFLLDGGAALATGRGERLRPLPGAAGEAFVVVSPRVTIARKTARLFGALTADDYGDGAMVIEQAARWGRGEPLAPELLENGFTRPLLALRPELAELGTLLRRLGAPVVAISGAGPSHYVPFAEPAAAARFAVAADARLGRGAEVFVVRGTGRLAGDGDGRG